MLKHVLMKIYIYLALTHMIRLSFADALLYRSTWEITMAPLICHADWTLHLSINIEAKLILEEQYNSTMRTEQIQE